MTIRSLLFLVLCFSPSLFAQDPAAQTQQVTKLAKQFLALLNEEQKEQASFAFQEPERENWHYVPMERKGLRLDAMVEKQQKATHQLLGQSLSTQGHLTAKDVIRLEALLYKRSNQDDFRNPDKYTVAIFGTPSLEQPWGWRFEGHHLSFNFSILSDKVTLTTPFFIGTNPAEVREGDLKGLRPLGKIEDAARTLARAIHRAGQHVRYSNKAPREILTGQDRIAQNQAPEGVKYSELSDQHKLELLALVKQIAATQRSEFLDLTAGDISESQLGWAGDFEKGKPHYFRIQTPDFLIEYANTQNKANHAHLVWRDFEGDFGRDLLKEHLQHDH